MNLAARRLAYRLALAGIATAQWGCGKTASPTSPDPAGSASPVADQGGLLVEYPNGGESFRVGGVIPIRLGYSPQDTANLLGLGLGGVVDLIQESGSGSRPIVQNLQTQVPGATDSQIPLDSAHVLPWTVPDSIYDLNTTLGNGDHPRIAFPTGTGFRIEYRAYDIGFYGKSDRSDAGFSIQGRAP